MKKIMIAGLIILAGMFAGCELMEDMHTFHLVYSITSLNEDEVDITVTYKVGNEYITEETQTPFVVEQNVELDKHNGEKYYYYMELKNTSDENINIYVTSNDEYKSKINNLKESYLPMPVYCRGYIGYGMASTTISY
jgi:hypothetical protein